MINSFIIAFSLLMITVSSCSKKGDMGPSGQQGDQGATGTIVLKTDGYIKGTLTGMRRDGTLISETFSYSTCFYEESYIDSMSPTQYVFSILRTVDAVNQSGARLKLLASSLSPITIAATDLDFSVLKSTGTTGLYFALTSNVSPSVSNVTYDRTTGIVTGNFIVNILGVDNNTGNAANITGSFKATVPVVHY